jgi:hypothetical protein
VRALFEIIDALYRWYTYKNLQLYRPDIKEYVTRFAMNYVPKYIMNSITLENFCKDMADMQKKDVETIKY